MDGVINFLLGVLSPVRGFMEPPFRWLCDAVGYQPESWAFLLYDLFALFLIYIVLRKVGAYIWGFFKRDSLADRAEIDALVTKNPEFVHSLEASKHLDATVRPLKQKKAWAQLGEVYASVNKAKEAAKYFKKAKDFKRAGEQLARAGQTVKAGKLLMRAGEFATAARFFNETNRFADAAKAYSKLGNEGDAAQAYGKAGKVKLACQHYVEYFQNPRDGKEKRFLHAQECAELLRTEGAKKKAGKELTAALLPHLAAAFEASERHELAGQLYREAGDLVRAGEVYVLAGRLQEAAECMKEAGREQEASRIGARYYETQERFKEAGTLYLQAMEYERAGDCFLKAKEPVRAGECFAKARSYFRAGFAYGQAGRYEDSVMLLQKLPESDPNFDKSRALIGRCFYELHDYAHCVATLENHLFNQKVEKGNIQYWYMLALALEQLGKLKESRDVLYKIGSVDRLFRDVGNRISSIDSRISMLESSGGAPAANPGAASAPHDRTEIIQIVENSLGNRYEIECEIGRGGMGVVYLAKDKQLHRKVALKFLGSLVDGSEEYRKRFVREARTAAKINHPNIVSIYDISASEGKAYIAMEFVEGMNLYKYVTAKTRLKPREAANIMVQALNALGAIHKEGIVHRDIKPDNILIAQGGVVKLMDFGLAKAEGYRITQPNMVMGTPAYMSPEQALGEEADARSDIYAMGLVLYELLTGEIVFFEGDVMKRQISEVPPKPSTQVEGIPPALDDIVMKAIEKNPGNRFQSAEEFARALRELKNAPA